MNQWNSIADFSADATLMATSGPALYRTADWSRVRRLPAASGREPFTLPAGDIVGVATDNSLLRYCRQSSSRLE